MNRTRRWLPPLVCLALAGAVWFVFGQTLQHPFINYDDPEYVLKNPPVARGLTMAGIAWAFTHVHASNWHPLTWISHMIDCQFFGLQPWGHHLSSVLLHMATSVALFLTLRQITGALWRSAFVAALFAIHPLRVESVAWVSERKDVLSGLFFVLTIWAYGRYVRRLSLGRYAPVLVLFACGLMSKPMLVTLPLILLLLDYWPLGRFSGFSGAHALLIPRRLLWEKLPLVVLALASSAATLFAQRMAIQPTSYVTPAVRVENAILSYTNYLRQMFLPTDLAVLYPLDAAAIPLASVASAFVVLVAITVAVWLWREQHRHLLTGWLWYLVMLLPVIGLIQVGAQARADRYTYLPQIGLYMMISWTAADAAGRWRVFRIALAPIAGVSLMILAITARTQAALWHDSETLWRAAIARTRDNPTALTNLGDALYEKGKLNEAIATYSSVLRAHPREPITRSALGVALLEQGETAASAASLEAAVEMAPSYAEAHYNLGNTYLAGGRAREAIEQYRAALALNPDDVEAGNNLAWILATNPSSELRDGAQAVALARRADTFSGGRSAIIAATLGAAYAEAGNYDEAIRAAERAQTLAVADGNGSRADAIAAQLARYRSRVPLRDSR
ncbi:MAG: tetratricopeptide repeat protein [Verrucomicrobiota bacterium]|nr:tetratricopeptide repeat protein [Verrucomicrobiota bacterium]